MGSELTPYAIVILAVVILIAVMLFLLFGLGAAYKGNFGGLTKMRTITIKASGFANAKPAEADMSLVANGTGKTTNDAVQNLTSTMNAFNSTIGSYINNNFSLVTTTYFNVYPRVIYNYSNGFYTSNRSGYIATEGLTVKLLNVSNVGGAIGSLSGIPSIYVVYVQQRLSDAQLTGMRSTALSNALANATSQATALVGTNNLTVENISINNFYYYPYYANNMLGGGASTGTVQYYGGIEQVTESITVTFSYGRKTGAWG